MGITRDTPSEVAWQDVQIWNGSDEYSWRYRADTILSTDGQTDRRTDGQTDGRMDKVIPVYPPINFVEAGGIINKPVLVQIISKQATSTDGPVYWHIYVHLGSSELTHWGRDKMDAISQTEMKMFEFRLKFHWSLFPRVQLTIFQHWVR